MSIVLYTIHCPQCKVLEMKLDKAGVEYMVVDDHDKIMEAAKEFGVKSAPFMTIDGEVFDFMKAITWVKEFTAKAAD